MMHAGRLICGRALRLMLVCGTVCAVLALAATPALARSRPATFYVGAAKENVTPADTPAGLAGFYLGGYGIGPVHLATGVLRPIYFRVIAIRDRDGSQVVIGAIDSQGYSIAYQNGPYGFNDIEQYIQSTLGIPESHIILQATHTHNGPDEIGVWGGVPDSYWAWVTQEMEAGITQAVESEQPARLKVGTADMTGFSGTFGSDTDSTDTGDNTDYPIDQQLRVLQAVTPQSPHGVIATLVNYSSHPTVYGPTNLVAPDWPGATATYLESDEEDMPAGASYGYPGSTAVVTVGAVGHTWPATVPKTDTDQIVEPVDDENNLGAQPNGSNVTANNFPADWFGNAVAQRAIDSVSDGNGFYVNQSLVDGQMRNVWVENTNPVLLAAADEPSNDTPLGGYKIERSFSPPWGYGDLVKSHVTTLRIGDIPFYGVPGEPYPSIKFSLDDQVQAPVQFMFGLANDQLGYAEELSDYNGAFQCSTSDEWFFTISPVFGSDVERLSRDNAKALGFEVTGSAVQAYRPGQVPPSTNCTEQEIEGQGLNGLPVG